MPSTQLPEPALQGQQVPSLAPDNKYAADPDPTEKSGFVRKISMLLIILATVGFVSWKIHGNLNSTDSASGDSGKKPGANSERAVPVRAEAVQQKVMPIYLTALGTATAYYSVTIKSRVDGQLTAVSVTEGQKVKRGQLLARVDPAPYTATLAQAEGQLTKDKAAAAYADAEATRYTALYNAGVVSQASQQSLVANAGQIAGSIQGDEAAIQSAKVNLDYTRITSPLDGVVGLRQVDPGNIVHAADSTGLMLVTQLQPITVVFTLPEDQIPQVQHALLQGAKLAVEAYDRSQSTLLATGIALTVDNQIDTTTGTVKVKAVFDNKDNSLFPNQFVNVRLILHQKTDALVIPAAAVQTGSQGNFVYVVRKGAPPKTDGSGSKSDPGELKGKHQHSDNAAVVPAADGGPVKELTADKPGDRSGAESQYYVEVRPIVIGVAEGSQVIVGSGVAAGERVVFDGLEKIKNGSRVSLIKSEMETGHRPLKGVDTPSDSSPATPDRRPPADPRDGGAGHKHSTQGKQS